MQALRELLQAEINYAMSIIITESPEELSIDQMAFELRENINDVLSSLVDECIKNSIQKFREEDE